MGIKVIALTPDDGWGFILKEGKTFLLRPPYTPSYQIELPRNVVEDAIHSHGFEKCNPPFTDVNEVIGFMKRKYIESKRNQGIDPPSSEQLRELLKYADDGVLFNWMNRIKRELIIEGKLDAAGFIVSELIKLERVKSNPEMWRMAMGIIERLNAM